MKPSNLTLQQKERIDSLIRKPDVEALLKWVFFVDDDIREEGFEKETSREYILEYISNVLQRRE